MLRSGRRGWSWRQFIKSHSEDVLPCDFLGQHTVHFEVIYVFAVMEVASRRVPLINVLPAGLVFVLRYGSILEAPRSWLMSRSRIIAELLGCSLCLGFWVGGLPLLEQALHTGVVDPWWMPRAAAFCWVADLGVDLVDEAIAALKRSGRRY